MARSPIPINYTASPDLPWGGGTWGGPFVYGGALWSVVYTTDNGAPVLRKSTNGGRNWTEMTPAPDNGSVVFWLDELRTGRYIPFLYRNTFFIRNYDLDTDTWSDIYGGAGPTGQASRGLALVRRSNGDVVLVHMTAVPLSPPFVNDLFYSICPDGGSWSSIDNILANPTGLSQRIHSACVDDDDRVHVLYSDDPEPNPPFSLVGNYVNVDTSDTVSPIETFSDWVPTTTGTSIIKALEDEKLYALQSGADGTELGSAIVVHIGSEWEAPTWTHEEVHDYGSGDEQPGQPGDVAFIGGTLTALWSTFNNDDTGYLRYSQRISSTWTTIAMYLDLSVTLPDPSFGLIPAFGDDFYRVDVATLGEVNGRMGVVYASFIEYVSDSDEGWMGFYVVESNSVNIAGRGPASPASSVNFA